jgi:hypothetical protein
VSPFSKEEMRLMSEANTTRRKVDYFRLPSPLWRKLKKKCSCPKRGREGGTRRWWQRPRASDREPSSQRNLVLRAFLAAVPVEGGSSGDWFGVSKKRHPRAFPERELETRMGILEKLIKRMAQYYYAKERDGIGWRWQKRDGFQEELRRPFGRRENRQESNR